jgi:integrase
LRYPPYGPRKSARGGTPKGSPLCTEKLCEGGLQSGFARVKLSAPMAESLGQIRPEGATGPVFPSKMGTPLNYSDVYRRVLLPALREAGVGHEGEDGKWDNEGVGFHAFRRACGSLLVNAGTDRRSQRLRHAQLATALAAYVEEVDDGSGAADTMGGLLLGPPWGQRTPANRGPGAER